jgi:hypothetical protein
MKKKIILSLAGLAVIIFGLIMLWPLSFSDVMVDDIEIYFIVTDLGVDENGRLENTTSNYIIKPDSDEFIQLRNILNKYSYHRSFRSFFNDTSMTGNDAGYWFHIYQIGTEVKTIITGGTGEVIINDRVYRIGYWSNKKALSMMDEIHNLLEQCIETTELTDGVLPFENLTMTDISSVTVEVGFSDLRYYDLSENEIGILTAILRMVEIFEQDNSYSEYLGQAVTYTLNKVDGTQETIMAYNPFIVINGIGYKTKYEPCEELNALGNTIAKTQFSR